MAKRTCTECLAENPADAVKCAECGAALTDELSEAPDDEHDSDEFKPGDIINDRYSVLKLIGRGGMGSIYKVHDRVLDEDLAFKVLLPGFAAEQEVVDRFINEVRITRKIAHPNIVRVHDFGTMGPRMFISMEYVEGVSLRDKLDKLKKGERLPLRQSLHIIIQLCIALKYAHHFTIHRDIKPDNIMITRGNNIKLMDFGISKLRDKRDDKQSGSVVGTPYYMAPEQMCNLPDIDSRADIYSIGVVMYELLTGSVPGNIPQPISQLNDETPLELDAVVMKCLAPERDKRYNNASELREALRPIIEGLHFSSSSGGGGSKDSASDAGSSQSPALNVFSDAMKAFARESQDSASSQPDTAFIRRISASDSDMDSDIVPSSAMADFTFDTAAKPSQAKKKPEQKQAAAILSSFQIKIIIAVVALLTIALILYLTSGYTRPRIEEYVYPDTRFEMPVLPEDISELLTGDLTIVEVYLAALERYSHDRTLTQRARVEALRNHALADIEGRAFSRPFSFEHLDSAREDLEWVSEFDNDPRIMELREALEREAAYFRFMLWEINRDDEPITATFRLNNPYVSQETQTVSENELLQDRFLVQSITRRSVLLEDTSERGQGRRFTAREKELLEAE